MNIPAPDPNKRHFLDVTERTAIYNHLIQHQKNGRVEPGIYRNLCVRFNTSESCLKRIWTQAKQSKAKGDLIPDIKPNKNKCGRKPVRTTAEIQQAVEQVPIKDRRTILKLSNMTTIPHSTLHRAKQSGVILRQTNTIKPYLTESNKRQRLEFCLSWVNTTSMKFEGFENVVHVAEKRFYMTKEGRNTYVTPNEETVYRHCKSKRFIAKVMFLAAVAQPRYDSTGACVFDGKLGLWPFTEQIPAQRRSKNRPRGTPVTMPININRDKYRAMLIDKVIPSIIAK
jgi:hypothetical protein